MENPNRFYTYAYLREDGTPYYIGKGKDGRIYQKNNKEVGKPKDKSRIIFLKQNLTEEESFKHEIYMISVFGRKDLGTGILHNKTNGGEGCSGVSENTRIKRSQFMKGKVFSQKTKQKMSIAKKGISHTEEHKRKISDSLKGEKNHFYGKSHNEESRKKMSESLKKRWAEKKLAQDS